MRLDRYLANNGFGSRSEVKKLISAGKIKVNGETVKDCAQNVTDGCVIEAVTAAGPGRVTEARSGYEYYMLNKPAGVVTAAYDVLCGTVMDLFDRTKRKGLNPVGRLDKDTEGLLLVTDDGNLGHFLTSPRRNVPKKYYAELRGIPDESGIERLKQGIEFKEFTSRPAELEIIEADEDAGTSRVIITVTEGRFHEVKRLAIAIGCEVKYLKRVNFAGLELDEGLKPGEYRPLTQTEIDRLKEYGRKAEE